MRCSPKKTAKPPESQARMTSTRQLMQMPLIDGTAQRPVSDPHSVSTSPFDDANEVVRDEGTIIFQQNMHDGVHWIVWTTENVPAPSAQLNTACEILTTAGREFPPRLPPALLRSFDQIVVHPSQYLSRFSTSNDLRKYGKETVLGT